MQACVEFICTYFILNTISFSVELLKSEKQTITTVNMCTLCLYYSNAERGSVGVMNGQSVKGLYNVTGDIKMCTRDKKTNIFNQ